VQTSHVSSPVEGTSQVPEKEPLRFAEYTLDFRRGCLRHGSRELVLRPKSFSVLCYLAENAGRLVSKEEIIKAVWQKTAVTDESVARCVSDVRLVLGDAGQQLIKTVPGRGYLFAIPGTPLPTQTLPTLETETSDVPWLSVVVLPFANLGEGGIRDYFVDALAEGLTTDLWRIPGAFVVASRSALAYKGKPVDARQIGRELGVRYVVAGSVLDGGDYVLIGAQLVDANTGAILWADRFERRRRAVLDRQGDLTARLARAISIALVAAESRRVERAGESDIESPSPSMRGRAGTAAASFTWLMGHRLRQERLLAGLNQEELARELRLDAEGVQAYESGKRPISAARLTAALRVLGVPVSTFFYGVLEAHRLLPPRRNGQRVPGIVVERPLKLFSGRSAAEFLSLLNVWETRRGAIGRDLLGDLLGGRLARKIILLRQPAGSSRLLFEHYAEGVAFVRPCQALALIGREYRDVPDQDFGRWLLRGYTETLSTGRPRLESMLADIRTPDAAVIRSRFDRLLLPWQGIGGDRYVLSLPLIRRRSSLSAADEPIALEA
jgi:TolB-like protein/transcriptional regulator with XRE-family HTH domain